MLESFVRRNVGEIDLMIERAEQRLSLYESTAERAEHAAEVSHRMRQGLERMRMYRRYVARMQTLN